MGSQEHSKCWALRPGRGEGSVPGGHTRPSRRSRKVPAWLGCSPGRQATMVLGWLLLLVLGLCPGATAIKECVFCELTDSAQCPGVLMRCGDDEDCFTGHGVAQGVGPIVNKGCVHSTSCGHEEPVSYMGLTYTLTTTCCSGQLCNRGTGLATGPPSLPLSLQLLLGLLLLLQHWL